MLEKAAAPKEAKSASKNTPKATSPLMANSKEPNYIEPETPKPASDVKSSWLEIGGGEDAAGGKTPLSKPKSTTGSLMAKRMIKAYDLNKNIGDAGSAPTVTLESEDPSITSKKWDLIQTIKIGRLTSQKNPATAENGVFDSKVLSRQHAEMWSENGKAFIMDTGSSNGTFLNGERLSPEGVGSMPWEIKNGDRIDFGVDIMNDETNTLLYKRVTLKVQIIGGKATESIASLVDAGKKTEAEEEVPAISVDAPSPEAKSKKSNSAEKVAETADQTLQRASKRDAKTDASKPSLDNALSLLADELAKAQSKSTDLENLAQQLVQIRTYIEKTKSASPSNNDKEVETLREKVQSLEKQIKSSGQEDKKFSNLQSALSSTEVQLANRTEELDKLKRKVAQLDMDLQTRDRELKNLTTEAKRTAEALESEKKASEKLKAQLSAKSPESAPTADKENAAADRTLEKKKKELEDKEKLVEKKRKELDEKERALDTRKLELDDKEKKINIVSSVENRSRRNSEAGSTAATELAVKTALDSQEQHFKSIIKRIEDDYKGRLERKDQEVRDRKPSFSVSPSADRKSSVIIEKELTSLRQTLQERDAQITDLRAQLKQQSQATATSEKVRFTATEKGSPKKPKVVAQEQQLREPIEGGQIAVAVILVLIASAVGTFSLYPELLDKLL